MARVRLRGDPGHAARRGAGLRPGHELGQPLAGELHEAARTRQPLDVLAHQRAGLQRPRQRPEPADVDVDLAAAAEYAGGSAEVLGAADRHRRPLAPGDRERAHALGRRARSARGRRGTRGWSASVTPTSDSRVPSESAARACAQRVVADVHAHGAWPGRLERERAGQRARDVVVAHRGQERRARVRRPGDRARRTPGG